MIKKLSDFEWDELSTDAAALAQNKAFDYVVEQLEARYFEQLKRTNIGDLTVPALHARLHVLEDLKQEFRALTTDIKFKRAKQ